MHEAIHLRARLAYQADQMAAVRCLVFGRQKLHVELVTASQRILRTTIVVSIITLGGFCLAGARLRFACMLQSISRFQGKCSRRTFGSIFIATLLALLQHVRRSRVAFFLSLINYVSKCCPVVATAAAAALTPEIKPHFCFPLLLLGPAQVFLAA